MTLKNLRQALLLNNQYVLEKIKTLHEEINNITGTDITKLKEDISLLQEMIDETQESLKQVSDNSIANINKRLDDINETIEYIKNTSIENLNDKILKNINDIQDLINQSSEISLTLNTHTENTIVHVTQEDKDIWNSILDSAKEYAKSLFDGVTSFNVEIVSELPTENIKTMTVYFLPNLSNQDNNYYDEYMYINKKWEMISSTFIDLTPYIKTETLNKILLDYATKKELHNHSNKEILDNISKQDISFYITDKDIDEAILDVLKILGGNL